MHSMGPCYKWLLKTGKAGRISYCCHFLVLSSGHTLHGELIRTLLRKPLGWAPSHGRNRRHSVPSAGSGAAFILGQVRSPYLNGVLHSPCPCRHTHTLTHPDPHALTQT